MTTRGHSVRLHTDVLCIVVALAVHVGVAAANQVSCKMCYLINENPITGTSLLRVLLNTKAQIRK